MNSIIPPPHDAYSSAHYQSMNHPDSFWAEAAEEIHWYKRWDHVLDDTMAPFYHWFSGGILNTCYNAVDRHVENGRAEQVALIHDSPVTNSIRKMTYRELRDQTARLAGALRARGVQQGDRVVIHMPMMIEGVVAMLACARLGAVHTVVFGGVPEEPLADQIDQVRPKVVVSASCGFDYNDVVDYMPSLLGAMGRLKNRPEKCIIYQRPEHPTAIDGRLTVDWADEMDRAMPIDCVPVLATDPLYILFTSGSTAFRPKGVVRDNGGHAVAVKWNMKNIYGVDPGDVYWAVSELAWVVGHTNVVYGPLLHGCTSILFEGKPVGTPDAGAYWRTAAEHSAKVFFTAPTRLRKIRSEDPHGDLIKQQDLSALKYLFVAGEPIDSTTSSWAQEHLGCPIVNHWWQAESGWSIAANHMALHPCPMKDGSPIKPSPGWDVRVLDNEGRSAESGQLGNLVCKLPLPPGTLRTLWENDAGYLQGYLERFRGYYDTSDAGYLDEDGYVFVMGRSDDVIMVAADMFSTAALEEVIAMHPDVAECAVIGAADEILGQVPVSLLVLRSDVIRPRAEIVHEVVELVNRKIGELTEFRKAVMVPALPKTRSGKILRGPMKKIADGLPCKTPATIEDPTLLDTVADALTEIGYAQRRS